MTQPPRQDGRSSMDDGRKSTVAEASGDLGRILGRDPRWFAALLVSVTVIAIYFAITVVGSAIFAFGDIVLIFFLAWLIAFIVSGAGLVRDRSDGKRMPGSPSSSPSVSAAEPTNTGRPSAR